MKTSLDCDGTAFVGSEMLISFIIFLYLSHSVLSWCFQLAFGSYERVSIISLQWLANILYSIPLSDKNILRHIIVGIFTIWVKFLCQNGKSYSTQTQVFAKKNLLTEREGTVELLQSTELLSPTTLIMKKRLHIIVF